MFDEACVYAPAKINLGLNVLPVRNDGFHEIESIFQTVSISDKLEIRFLEDYGKCSVFCEDLVLPLKNTITLAYDAFCKVVAVPVHSVAVKLTKHIPDGGGLGGGSSDAAAFIRALEKAYDLSFTDAQLDFIASEVGSDVFFFIHCEKDGCGCAVVSGRGENLRFVSKRSDLYFVLAFPNVHSSTKEAYALIDEQFDKKTGLVYPSLDELESIYNSPVEEWTFKNAFTPVLVNKYPEIGYYIERIRKTDALYVNMSGSGSTVFGVYAVREKALDAVKSLGYEGIRCLLTSWFFFMHISFVLRRIAYADYRVAYPKGRRRR